MTLRMKETHLIWWSGKIEAAPVPDGLISTDCLHPFVCNLKEKIDFHLFIAFCISNISHKQLNAIPVRDMCGQLPNLVVVFNFRHPWI